MIITTGHGRLARDPQIRQTTSGQDVCTVTVACSQRNRDDRPVYVDLVLWDGAATAAAAHLVKGQAGAFTGHMRTRTYTDRNDQTRFVVELIDVDTEWSSKPAAANTAD